MGNRVQVHPDQPLAPFWPLLGRLCSSIRREHLHGPPLDCQAQLAQEFQA